MPCGAGMCPPLLAGVVSARLISMRQSELIDLVQSYLPDSDEDLIQRACSYATHKHRHQTRSSGAAYITHPISVAAIVAEMRLDEASVVAALLHDTIEATDATRAEIDASFGPEIGALVDGLTKLSNIELVSKKTRQGENLRRLLLAVSNDVRVLLVKLADRLHNMRTLQHVPPEKRARIGQETLDIYAPLAGRMGMQTMRDELEELSFMHLLPEAHALIHDKLASMAEDATEAVLEIEKSLVEWLSQSGIEAVVKSRQKRPYSVYRKMENNRVSFEQLSDLIGFRVIVDRVEQCYNALGIVHTRWPAVPGRFKDYISTPKQNDYRSIHTTIAGPMHQRVELQIRTHEMNDIAEYGIAAHALYKDGVYDPSQIDMEADDVPSSRAYAWLRRTVDTLSQGDHADDVLEHTRLELFLDQVFCFTPKGRLIALPLGATAIDFAYAVHTKVGDTCVACRINGRNSQVVTKLKNGDEVQIIRSDDENYVPPVSWENVAVTGKAKAGVRRAAREALDRQFRDTGVRILQSTFKRAGHEFEPDALELALPKLARESVTDAIAAVGRSELDPSDVLKAVHPDYRIERTSTTAKASPSDGWFSLSGVGDFLFRIPGRRRRKNEAERATESAVPFSGADAGMAVRINLECGAVPGDRIVGIVEEGKGITVYPIEADALQEHEDNAHNWIDLRWQIDPENPSRFPARIEITAVNAPGTLADITEVIAKADANIVNLYLEGPDSGLSTMVFGVEVWDARHLARLLRALRALSVTTEAKRLYG